MLGTLLSLADVDNACNSTPVRRGGCVPGVAALRQRTSDAGVLGQLVALLVRSCNHGAQEAGAAQPPAGH